jgi:hypothetical protein
MADELQEQEDKPLNVGVTFRIPARMPSVYAHHLLAQQDEAEIILSFFEVMLPVVTTDEQVKIIQQTGIPADCVARVTIAKHRFLRFMEILEKVREDILTDIEAGEEYAETGNDQTKNQ